MKYLKALPLLFITVCTFSQNTYTDSIIEERKSKEMDLLDSKKGILTEVDLQHFESLNYFFTDTSYIFIAKFEKSIGKKFKMPTSTDRMPIYRRYGYLRFNYRGKEHQLTVYQNMELKGKKKYKNYYFIPFRDMTSGIMTYGGGRYIDMTIEKDQTILKLDFNKAYNPYCAYSHRYSCPLPPEENKLSFFVYSGEKTPIYKKEE
jgi:uncharacterized protein (DUF1684 family)